MDEFQSVLLFILILAFWPVILVAVTLLVIIDVFRGNPRPAQPTSGSVMS